MSQRTHRQTHSPFLHALGCVVAGLTGASLMLSFQAFADAPTPGEMLIGYSGTLEIDGQATTGPVDMRFELFSEPTGGNLLWTEEWSSDAVCEEGEGEPVQVFNGQFAVNLGHCTPLDGVDFSANARYLSVEVRRDGEGDFVTLGGRQRFNLVPKALFAVSAEGGHNFNVTGILEVEDKLHVASTGQAQQGRRAPFTIGNPEGVHFRADNNGFFVRDSRGEEEIPGDLFIQQNGGRTVVQGDLAVDGDLEVGGNLLTTSLVVVEDDAIINAGFPFSLDIGETGRNFCYLHHNDFVQGSSLCDVFQLNDQWQASAHYRPDPNNLDVLNVECRVFCLSW